MLKTILKNSSTEEVELETLRHTACHVLAHAVKRLYPEVKLVMGESIEDKFYYDFDCEHIFIVDDLNNIEEEMNKIVKEDIQIESFQLPIEMALDYLKDKEQPYKVEIIKDQPEDEVITFYKQGDFIDLCVSPHLPSTKYLKEFRLLNIVKIYCKENEKNKMLQRIYGSVFSQADSRFES